MLILTLIVQVYIVAGGEGGGSLTSTETLEKDGGSAWQVVASLPSHRQDGESGEWDWTMAGSW